MGNRKSRERAKSSKVTAWQTIRNGTDGSSRFSWTLWLLMCCESSYRDFFGVSNGVAVVVRVLPTTIHSQQLVMEEKTLEKIIRIIHVHD